MCLCPYKNIHYSINNRKCWKDTNMYQETCYINNGTIIHKIILQPLKRMKQLNKKE